MTIAVISSQPPFPAKPPSQEYSALRAELLATLDVYLPSPPRTVERPARCNFAPLRAAHAGRGATLEGSSSYPLWRLTG